MKTIIIAIGIIALMVGLLLNRDLVLGYLDNSLEVKNENKELEVEEVKIPEWQIDEDAIQAAKDVIHKKELEAELKELKEIASNTNERIEEIEKELGVYWREVSNLKREVQKVANKYNVNSRMMETIINCESQWNITIQSNHRYTVTNVPKGYKVGDREMSFGLVQIHLPAHPNITKEQAIDPEFAIDFLGKNLAQGKETMWTCAKLAMN